MTRSRPDYARFTLTPEEADCTCDAQAPLPPLTEPETQPDFDPHAAGLDAETLVPAGGAGVIELFMYLRAGWAAARHDMWTRSGVAARLVRVSSALPDGFGLAVFDAWRPLALQEEIYEATYGPGAFEPGLAPGYVSEPVDDPSRPPPHLTGGTVDLTLTFHGEPLALGTAFDAFTPRAHADALESEAGTERELRRLLYWAMRAEDFVVYTNEWWHFEYGTRRWAAILGRDPQYGPATDTLR